METETNVDNSRGDCVNNSKLRSFRKASGTKRKSPGSPGTCGPGEDAKSPARLLESPAAIKEEVDGGDADVHVVHKKFRMSDRYGHFHELF